MKGETPLGKQPRQAEPQKPSRLSDRRKRMDHRQLEIIKDAICDADNGSLSLGALEFVIAHVLWPQEITQEGIDWAKRAVIEYEYAMDKQQTHRPFTGGGKTTHSKQWERKEGA